MIDCILLLFALGGTSVPTAAEGSWDGPAVERCGGESGVTEALREKPGIVSLHHESQASWFAGDRWYPRYLDASHRRRSDSSALVASSAPPRRFVQHLQNSVSNGARPTSVGKHSTTADANSHHAGWYLTDGPEPGPGPSALGTTNVVANTASCTTASVEPLCTSPPTTTSAGCVPRPQYARRRLGSSRSLPFPPPRPPMSISESWVSTFKLKSGSTSALERSATSSVGNNSRIPAARSLGGL